MTINDEWAGPPELVCPAGSLPALRAAVDHGADAVYIGFRGETNARNFPGLNFSAQEAATGIAYARAREVRVFVALNVYPAPGSWPLATAAVDQAASLGVDALILADPGLMAYALKHHPELRLHLSVQASATNWKAIEFYRREFGIRRAVLPRVLSCTQVQRLIARTSVEIEVFGFGSLCVMVEGRCAVAEYQTLCKGRLRVDDNVFQALEEPTSLNVLDVLPALISSRVSAIKVEGRQRSPAYVAEVTKLLRQAIDQCSAAGSSWTSPE